MNKLIISLLITISFIVLANKPKAIVVNESTTKVTVSSNHIEKTFSQVKEFIKKKEGLRLIKYTFPAGKPTIGYGHVIKSNENLLVISKKQADSILTVDMDIALRSIKKDISLDSAIVLISPIINLGANPVNKIISNKSYDKLKKYCYARKGKHGMKVKYKSVEIRRNGELAMLNNLRK